MPDWYELPQLASAAFREAAQGTESELEENFDLASAVAGLLEVSAEQSFAIYFLCDAGLWRPALAVQRALIESAGLSLWLRRHPDRVSTYETEKLVIRDVVSAIAPDLYKGLYGRLSNFVHSKEGAVTAYRDFEAIRDLAPEVGTAPIVLAGNFAMSFPEMSEAKKDEMYGPYLGLVTLDLALEVARLHGVSLSAPLVETALHQGRRALWRDLHIRSLLHWPDWQADQLAAFADTL